MRCRGFPDDSIFQIHGTHWPAWKNTSHPVPSVLVQTHPHLKGRLAPAAVQPVAQP